MLSVSQSQKGGALIQEVRTITGLLALPPTSLAKQTRCFRSLTEHESAEFGHNNKNDTLEAKTS